MPVFVPYLRLLKALLLFGLLLAVPALSFAQLRVGPKIGGQLSRTVFADKDYRNEYSSEFRPGFQLGGVVNYRVNETYSLETELFYIQKRKFVQNRPSDIVVEQTKHSASYHYLDLPVLLRLSKHTQFNRQPVELYVNIGPNINYWFGGRGTIENDEYIEFRGSDKQDYKIVFQETYEANEVYVKDAKRLQMSLDFGAGMIFGLGLGQSIMIDVRNSFGLGKTYMGRQDSANYDLYTYNDNFEAVNHAISFSVAYLLDIDVQALLIKGRIRR